jgi:hypothetical protein
MAANLGVPRKRRNQKADKQFLESICSLFEIVICSGVPARRTAAFLQCSRSSGPAGAFEVARQTASGFAFPGHGRADILI